VANSDFLACRLLPMMLVEFRRHHPSVEVEVTISSQFTSVTRRDADLAIRSTSAVPDNLIGKRMLVLGYGIYGHSNLIDGDLTAFSASFLQLGKVSELAF